MRLLGWIGCVLWVHAALAQNTLYAPDLRWDDGLHATLLLVNPGDDALTVEIAGYRADGSTMGVKTVSLAAKARYGVTALELFDNDAIAWVELNGDAPIAGAVRYDHADGARFSLAPLTPIAGSQIFLSQPGSPIPGYLPATALVNASDAAGEAVIQPVKLDILAQEDVEPRAPLPPVAVPGFGAPRQQTLFAYNSLFKGTDQLLWDQAKAGGGAALSAVQHLIGFGAENPGLASAVPPRSDYREMIVAAVHPRRDTYRNRLVLINTYPVELTVDFEAHQTQRDVFEGTILLAPYERREFDLDNPTERDIPGGADWYRLLPVEGGLTGYQLIHAQDGRALAAVEPDIFSASAQALPYTPGNGQLQSEIGMINLSPYRERFYLTGYDESGAAVASHALWLDSLEKRVATTDSLFGDDASSVAWTRIGSLGARIVAFAAVSQRDGGAVAATLGAPLQSGDESIFMADFEHLETISLEDQNWRFHIVDEPDRFPTSPRNAFTLLFNMTPQPGDLFLENQYGALEGHFSVGYETIHAYPNLLLIDRDTDDVTLLASPFFEVPAFGDYYLSFYMRLIDPDLATEDSEFGVAWRIEGESRWRWFGLTGFLWQTETEDFLGRWMEGLPYRNRISKITEWLPFEKPLPADTHGKRIQIAYYQRFSAEGQDISIAPVVLIDRISIAGAPLPASYFFQDYGEGELQFTPKP